MFIGFVCWRQFRLFGKKGGKGRLFGWGWYRLRRFLLLFCLTENGVARRPKQKSILTKTQELGIGSRTRPFRPFGDPIDKHFVVTESINTISLFARVCWETEITSGFLVSFCVWLFVKDWYSHFYERGVINPSVRFLQKSPKISASSKP